MGDKAGQRSAGQPHEESRVTPLSANPRMSVEEAGIDDNATQWVKLQAQRVRIM
jgi:hypothetical protein